LFDSGETAKRTHVVCRLPCLCRHVRRGIFCVRLGFSSEATTNMLLKDNMRDSFIKETKPENRNKQTNKQTNRNKQTNKQNQKQVNNL
jgi:hypothetical protein